MLNLLSRFRHALIAIVALALSAGLAFGAQPPDGWGLTNAADHAGKTVPVQAASDEDTETDEETAEDTETEQDAGVTSAEAGENCTTDPTGLPPEELAGMKHGSIVCWAAQQTEWPEWFANHGSFVRCWAHTGKPDAIACADDPTTVEPVAATAGKSHGNGKAHGQGKNKH